MDGPLWPVPDLETANRFLQMARTAFGNKDTLSNTFLSIDNPVSMTRAALQNQVAAKKYYVAHKADGTRFVLCLDFFRNNTMAAFVNRAGNVFITFVRARKRLFQMGCVFDGEFCVSENKSHYLVFNVLQYNGVSLRDTDYTHRLAIVRENFAAEPRALGVQEKQPAWQIDSVLPNFFFWVKPTILTTMLSQLPIPQFPNDGLIFTPANERVRTGRNEMLLKWKPQNTVDVGFEMIYDAHAKGFRMVTWFDDDVTGRRVPLLPDYDVTLSSVADSAKGFLLAQSMCPSLTWSGIFECWCVVHPRPPHILHVKHTRPDKFTANTPITVQRTLQTIRENITEGDIREICQQKTTSLLTKVFATS
jgi:mRNA capping enzyme, catalytic domain